MAPALLPFTLVNARRWVILVHKDELALYRHLREAFEKDNQVQVILDRRKHDTRNPRWVNEQLRTFGAVVIRQPK